MKKAIAKSCSPFSFADGPKDKRSFALFLLCACCISTYTFQILIIYDWNSHVTYNSNF